MNKKSIDNSFVKWADLKKQFSKEIQMATNYEKVLNILLVRTET